MSRKFSHRIANSPSVALQTEHALKIMDKTDQAGAAAKGEEPRIPKGEPGAGEWTYESHPETNTLRIMAPDGSYEDRTGGSPAWRHYNPGNLRPFDEKRPHDYGAIGASGPRGKQFLIFKSEEDGKAALEKDLKKRAATGQPLLEIMKHYAPKGDHNDPVGYAKTIADFAGISPSTKLNSPEGQQAMPKIFQAIHRQEGWVEGRINRSTESQPQ
jgi:hypothetical protein